jgi:hypothetical protein
VDMVPLARCTRRDPHDTQDVVIDDLHAQSNVYKRDALPFKVRN